MESEGTREKSNKGSWSRLWGEGGGIHKKNEGEKRLVSHFTKGMTSFRHARTGRTQMLEAGA